jgi:hypothetical protein
MLTNWTASNASGLLQTPHGLAAPGACICRRRCACSEEALYQVLSSVGQHILDMRVIRDKFTGAPRSAPGTGAGSVGKPMLSKELLCGHSRHWQALQEVDEMCGTSTTTVTMASAHALDWA